MEEVSNRVKCSHWAWKVPLEMVYDNPSARGEGQLRQVALAIYSGVWDIIKDGDSTSSLDNLWRCLITLTIKKGALLHLWGISCVSDCSHCFSSCHWTLLRRLWLYHPYTLLSSIFTNPWDLPELCLRHTVEEPAPSASPSVKDTPVFWGFCGPAVDFLQYFHVSCTGDPRSGPRTTKVS